MKLARTAMAQEGHHAHVEVVELSYQQLLGDQDLTEQLKRAFGPQGLGIVLISGVPDVQQLRAKLLPLASQLAALPPSVLERLEDPASSYSFGWSSGKEALSDGSPDTQKGSFYANPFTDKPIGGDELTEQHPSYFRPNIWPDTELPGLEPALKAMGRLIIEVGMLVAKHIDRLLAGQEALSQVEVLSASRAHKARLLHYKAVPDTGAVDDVASSTPVVLNHDQAWCGWHTDHGSLTGLLSGMFMRDGQEVPCPDRSCGLWVRNRKGDIVRAAIPPSHLAFQVGEALQVHSGGQLQATPHYVRAAQGAAGRCTVRNTFAVFLQPDVTCAMVPPPGTPIQQVEVGSWLPAAAGRPPQDFGQFTALTLSRYYQQAHVAVTARISAQLSPADMQQPEAKGLSTFLTPSGPPEAG